MAIRQQFLVFQKQIKINSSNLDKFSIKIASKNTSKQRRFFCPSKLGQTKHVKTISIFCSLKSHQTKCVQKTSLSRSSKLQRTNYVKTTSFFQPSKLRQTKYAEMTSIFRPSKLHRKSTSKRRVNSSIVSLQSIDVILISPSNRPRFDGVSSLGRYAD